MTRAEQLVQQAEVHPIAGNYDGDANTWRAIDRIWFEDGMTNDLRARLLRVINRITGEDDPTDEVAVKQYTAWLESNGSHWPERSEVE